MEELFKLSGQVHVMLFDENGKLKQEHTSHNLVVSGAKTYLATLAVLDAFMPYIAVGTDGTPPILSNVALGAEITGVGNSRALGVLSNNSNSWTNQATFAPGNCTATIQEAGLFSDVTGGVMFARQVFAPYIKSASDTLIIIWTITIS